MHILWIQKIWVYRMLLLVPNATSQRCLHKLETVPISHLVHFCRSQQKWRQKSVYSALKWSALSPEWTGSPPKIPQVTCWPATTGGVRLQGHGGKLGNKVVCWTVPLRGLDCVWLSRGNDRLHCAFVFTARRLKWQLNREQRCWNTDLRQMMKTQGSTMGLRA